MTHRSTRNARFRVVLAAAAMAAVIPVVSLSSAQARQVGSVHTANLPAAKFCAIATKAQVAHILGVQLVNAQSISGGKNALCVYATKSSTQAAYSSLYAGTSRAKYNGLVAAARKQKFNPKTVTIFGAYPAYEVVYKQSAKVTSNRVIVLKGTQLLSVGSNVSSMSTVVALTRTFLPHL